MLFLAAGVFAFFQACQKDDRFLSEFVADLKKGQAVVNQANTERTFYSSALHIGDVNRVLHIYQKKSGQAPRSHLLK